MLALTQSSLTIDITSMSTTRIKWKCGVRQVINKTLPSALYWDQVYIYLKQTPKQYKIGEAVYIKQKYNKGSTLTNPYKSYNSEIMWLLILSKIKRNE